MKALRFINGRLQLAEVPRPDTAEEVVIQIAYAGICATDAAIVRGYTNFSGTLGHEFVGVVVSAPDPSWIGQRVVGDINVACGVCNVCRAGNAHHCEQRTVIGIRQRDGVFAEYLALPLRNLYAVPDSVSDLDAVFAEPLAAACHIVEQVSCRPGQSVAVLGDGKLGQLIAQVLHAHGLAVTLVGRHARKLTIAAEAGIATCQADELRTAARLFEVVVEASGRATVIADALRLVRPRGTVVLKSTSETPWVLSSSAVVVPEVTLVGSRCGDMPAALALLAARKINPQALIEAVYDLSDGLRAFEHAVTPGALKVLLRCCP
ncbi:MAG: MDR/zinc-dependent alcohol dehydrogenase-like family protein [Acidobacteriota bacterium]